MMLQSDRVAVVLYQLLFREESEAAASCDFSLEVIKRNPTDAYAQLKHFENCMRLKVTKELCRKMKDTLDSMTDKGV